MRQAAYYNEIDPFAAAWLRELIKAGLIADGEVDERSIELVQPDDLRGFVQCHFFAGIGGWSYALRLAGWPDDRAVWTGSCPCQPFSAAGRGDGERDSRDLWPAWFRLWCECRPVVGFGEQVEGAARGGWLDRLCADLEGEQYAVGACVLGAHSVRAFHRRQRLYFVADATGLRTERLSAEGQVSVSDDHWCGEVGELADTETIRQRQGRADTSWRDERTWAPWARFGLTDYRGRFMQPDSPVALVTEADILRQLADADGGQSGDRALQPGRQHGQRQADGAVMWEEAEWIACTDGKARPVEPGTFPLAHGVPARVGRLRGYGNAIVPQVAAAFIEAYCEARALNV
jgi:DNA (cytosine-5)-methyltransferase 1